MKPQQGSARRASARVRAERLVRKVERAIERGEFTPEQVYYGVYNVLGKHIGPCGCALAGAQFVAGLNAVTPGAWHSVPGLTAIEARELECGYEAYRQPSNAGPFYEAGKTLRKFHPEASE